MLVRFQLDLNGKRKTAFSKLWLQTRAKATGALGYQADFIRKLGSFCSDILALTCLKCSEEALGML